MDGQIRDRSLFLLHPETPGNNLYRSTRDKVTVMPKAWRQPQSTASIRPPADSAAAAEAAAAASARVQSVLQSGRLPSPAAAGACHPPRVTSCRALQGPVSLNPGFCPPQVLPPEARWRTRATPVPLSPVSRSST